MLAGVDSYVLAHNERPGRLRAAGRTGDTAGITIHRRPGGAWLADRQVVPVANPADTATSAVMVMLQVAPLDGGASCPALEDVIVIRQGSQLHHCARVVIIAALWSRTCRSQSDCTDAPSRSPY